jgi:hypothetical protein
MFHNHLSQGRNDEGPASGLVEESGAEDAFDWLGVSLLKLETADRPFRGKTSESESARGERTPLGQENSNCCCCCSCSFLRTTSSPSSCDLAAHRSLSFHSTSHPRFHQFAISIQSSRNTSPLRQPLRVVALSLLHRSYLSFAVRRSKAGQGAALKRKQTFPIVTTSSPPLRSTISTDNNRRRPRRKILQASTARALDVSQS